MARTRKKHQNGSLRGGTSPAKTDTAFGAAGNKNTTKKNYAKLVPNTNDR